MQTTIQWCGTALFAFVNNAVFATQNNNKPNTTLRSINVGVRHLTALPHDCVSPKPGWGIAVVLLKRVGSVMSLCSDCWVSIASCDVMWMATNKVCVEMADIVCLFHCQSCIRNHCQKKSSPPSPPRMHEGQAKWQSCGISDVSRTCCRLLGSSCIRR